MKSYVRRCIFATRLWLAYQLKKLCLWVWPGIGPINKEILRRREYSQLIRFSEADKEAFGIEE